MDPTLDPSTVPDPVLAVVAEVALICLAEEPSDRPHMREVVGFLQPAAAFKEETGAENTVSCPDHPVTRHMALESLHNCPRNGNGSSTEACQALQTFFGHCHAARCPQQPSHLHGNN